MLGSRAGLERQLSRRIAGGGDQQSTKAWHRRSSAQVIGWLGFVQKPNKIAWQANDLAETDCSANRWPAVRRHIAARAIRL